MEFIGEVQRKKIDLRNFWVEFRNFVSADDVVHKTAENWRVEGQILARGQCKGLRAYSQWPFRGKNRRGADEETTAPRHLRKGDRVRAIGRATSQ